jgi:DNA mismatch repair protein MutS
VSSAVRRQYLQCKAVHPDALLFFRLGDFYELFDHDAEVASRELQLTLTGREFGKGERSPMAGVPHAHVETYIARLVERGYLVAVAEQVGDPRLAKGLVERRITRLVTPGTIREPSMLEPSRNNFLAAILPHSQAAGIAYADITTGEFTLQQVVGEPLDPLILRELQRIEPAEVLWPLAAVQVSLEPDPAVPASPDAGAPPLVLPGAVMTPFAESHFAEDHGRARLSALTGSEQAANAPWVPFGLAIGAAGALLDYLEHTQPGSLPILRPPVFFRASEHMTLDAATRRNLELTHTMRGGAPSGSLLAVLDRTRTPMGGRLLRRWLAAPLVTPAPLKRRQAAVTQLVEGTALRLRVLDALAGIGDIDRVVARAQQGQATPRELIALCRALDRSRVLRSVLAGIPPVGHSGEAATLFPTGSTLDACREALDSSDHLATLIRAALVDEPPPTTGEGGFVRPGYQEEVDAVDAGSREAREWMAGLEAVERTRTGIRSLKVVYSRVFGYAIEVSKSNLAQVPDEYVRKQTVAGGERYVTVELKQRESQLLQAREQRLRLELAVLEDLRARVASRAEHLLRAADAVGQIDVYGALAVVALEREYSKPELDEGDSLIIEEGRHPVVEVTQREVAFVPNDTSLDANGRIAVLTGPNMAGKSTYLRQVALIVLLAQVGSYVPARAARIGLVDRIFTRVGAQDDLAAGQSTFMVEMAETSAILAECTPRSLLILDEIGRGTSTYDGLAIAQAVIEYLHDDPGHRAKTIFATHYHELTALAGQRPHVRNYRMEVLEEGNQIVFLRRVAPGGADRSYGVHVAELAGLPKSVIHRARQLLRGFEATTPEGRATRRRIQESATQLQLALFEAAGPADGNGDR